MIGSSRARASARAPLGGRHPGAREPRWRRTRGGAPLFALPLTQPSNVASTSSSAASGAWSRSGPSPAMRTLTWVREPCHRPQQTVDALDRNQAAQEEQARSPREPRRGLNSVRLSAAAGRLDRHRADVRGHRAAVDAGGLEEAIAEALAQKPHRGRAPAILRARSRRRPAPCRSQRTSVAWQMHRCGRPAARLEATHPLGTHQELTSASQSTSSRSKRDESASVKLAAPAQRPAAARRLSGAPLP